MSSWYLKAACLKLLLLPGDLVKNTDSVSEVWCGWQSAFLASDADATGPYSEQERYTAVEQHPVHCKFLTAAGGWTPWALILGPYPDWVKSPFCFNPQSWKSFLSYGSILISLVGTVWGIQIPVFFALKTLSCLQGYHSDCDLSLLRVVRSR